VQYQRGGKPSRVAKIVEDPCTNLKKALTTNRTDRMDEAPGAALCRKRNVYPWSRSCPLAASPHQRTLYSQDRRVALSQDVAMLSKAASHHRQKQVVAGS